MGVAYLSYPNVTWWAFGSFQFLAVLNNPSHPVLKTNPSYMFLQYTSVLLCCILYLTSLPVSSIPHVFLIYPVCHLSPSLESKLHKGRDFCFILITIVHWTLKLCLSYSRQSVKICWISKGISEWMNWMFTIYCTKNIWGVKWLDVSVIIWDISVYCPGLLIVRRFPPSVTFYSYILNIEL